MSGSSASSFNPRVIVGLIVAGIVGFAGFWLLSAFTPELASGNNGGTHALSRSATGFSGLVELAQDAGLHPRILRSTGSNGTLADSHNARLLVLTPPAGAVPSDVLARIGDYEGTVLIVLPKHLTEPFADHRGWVRAIGRDGGVARLLPVDQWRIHPTLTNAGGIAPGAALPLSIDGRKPVDLPAPDGLVTIGGKGLVTVAELGDAAVMASPADHDNIVILADPDLINNHALRSAEGASAALAILRSLAGPNDGIAFDVTLNGLGSGNRSLLRLALTPPFLGLTLCLVAASALALWQGFVRFGPVWREERAIALGKAALVGNSARLIIQARRLPDFAPRYAAMAREAAAARLHAPAGLAGVALDRWLDRFTDAGGARFSNLVAALTAARSNDEVVRGAAAISRWRRDVTRDG